MTVIKYDLIGAIKSGIKEHPQKDVERLGMKVLKYEGVPIADCAMMGVDEIIDNLPDYIEKSNHKF